MKSLNEGEQVGKGRGIYPTLMVRHTIELGLFGKPHTKRHQSTEGACRRAQNALHVRARRQFKRLSAEHARSHGTTASAAGKFCEAMCLARNFSPAPWRATAYGHFPVSQKSSGNCDAAKRHRPNQPSRLNPATHSFVAVHFPLSCSLGWHYTSTSILL